MSARIKPHKARGRQLEEVREAGGQEQAQGILVAALGMLPAHFGHSEARRAS